MLRGLRYQFHTDRDFEDWRSAMLNSVIRTVAIVCVLGILSTSAMAQRGGGGPRGGGGGGRGGGPGGFGGGTAANTGGGRMCSGMNSAGTAANAVQNSSGIANFFANNAANSNLANPFANRQQQRTRPFQNNSTAVANAANRNRPTSAQFIRAALRFDADNDSELDESELTEVATAVINELRRRQPMRTMGINALAGLQRPPRPTIPPDVPMNELTAAFVTKALTYDRDDNGTLNAAETRALATAFIRSLG